MPRSLRSRSHSRRLAVDDAVQPLIDELTKDPPDSFQFGESFAVRCAGSRTSPHCSIFSISATPARVRRPILAGDKTLTKKCWPFTDSECQVRDDVRGQSDWVATSAFRCWSSRRRKTHRSASTEIGGQRREGAARRHQQQPSGNINPVLVEEFIDGRSSTSGSLATARWSA